MPTVRPSPRRSRPAPLTPLRWGVILLALCLLGGPLAVALAALSGIGHRWVDILAQFTAPALFVAIALTVLLALLRLRIVAGLGVLTCLLLLVALWPQWRPAPGQAEPGAPTVRLYSANLWVGNQDTAAIGRSIAAADPDIVILIELGDTPAASMDALLAKYPHRVMTPRVVRANGASRSLIAARFPLHPIADRPDGLDAVAAVADTPIGPITLIGAHLTRPWPFQFQWGQITQVQALTALRRDLPGPMIVAGDFNSVSSARIGRQVRTDMTMTPASGWPGTWPSDLPAFVGIAIDQVYRSPDLAFVDRRLGSPTGSDHRPVITVFTRAKR